MAQTFLNPAQQGGSTPWEHVGIFGKLSQMCLFRLALDRLFPELILL